MSDIDEVLERFGASSARAAKYGADHYYVRTNDIRTLLHEIERMRAIDLEQFRVQANGAIDSLTQNRLYPADVDFALACIRHILGMIDGSNVRSSSEHIEGSSEHIDGIKAGEVKP